MKKLLLLLLFLPLIGFAQTPDLDWAFNLDSEGISQGLEVISDNKGHIYVAGLFESTVDFDPGPATTTQMQQKTMDRASMVAIHMTVMEIASMMQTKTVSVMSLSKPLHTTQTPMETGLSTC